MNGLELLVWARGPGLALALAILVGGVLLRFIEILSLGRKADLSPARAEKDLAQWAPIIDWVDSAD